MWKKLLIVLAGVALLLPTVSPTLAQTADTGTLVGAVLGPEGPVAEAVVTVAQADGSNQKLAVTDGSGRFLIAFLPPGNYVLEVVAEGLQSKQVTDLRISAAQQAKLTVELANTTISDAIEVVAAAPLLDTANTELGRTLTSEEIELLPTSRTATDLLAFNPGMRPGQVWGGSTEQANSYQLDGVGVNQPGFGGDFLLPNVDWIEEIEVKGLGSGAEYGNFQGGLVNMVTKSGGNEPRVNLRFNYEDRSLNSSNLDTFDVGGERDDRLELSADWSGALIQDKLFFFLSAGQSETAVNIVDGPNSTPDDLVFLPIQEVRTESKIFGKLNWDVTKKDRLGLVLGWDTVETDNRGLGSFTAPEAAQSQESPSIFYNFSWQRVVNGSNLLELKFTGFDGRDDRLPLHGDTSAVQLLGGNRDLFGNAVHTRDRDLTSNAATFAWDSYFDLGHTVSNLKVGASYDEGTWLEQRRRNGGFTWRPERGSGAFDPQNPSTWGFISSDWGGDIRLDAETTNAALFAQDYLDLGSRLTLSFGLRYGMWEGRLNPGFGNGGSFVAVEDEAIAPRIGLVADLTGKGKTVAKAHWGRYYQGLFALMFDRVEGGDVFQNTEFWDWIAPFDPDLSATYTEDDLGVLFEFFDDVTAGDEVGPAENYDQPYVDQLVLSIEQAIGDSWKLGATFVNRKNEDVIALVDRNLDRNFTALSNISVIDFASGNPLIDDDGNPLVLDTLWISNDDILYVGSAPGLTPGQVDQLSFDRDLVLTNEPSAERTFDQLQLTLDGRLSDWSLSAAVAFTELEGNFFSVSGYDDPGGTGSGAFVLKNEQTNFRGDLQSFSEWEVKLRASGDLPWGLRGGAFLTLAAGDKFTPRYSVDRRRHDFVTAAGEFLDPDLIFGITGERIFLDPRGAREYDDFTRLDVYLDRVFPAGRGDLVVGVDIFNLTNEDAVTAVKTLVNDQDPVDPTTAFGAVRSRQSPRTVRLSLSYRF